MTDSLLVAAHATGYLHGLVIGASLGAVLGFVGTLFLLALLRAASIDPPTPDPVVLPFRTRMAMQQTHYPPTL